MPTLTKSKAADKPPPRTTTRSRQPPSRSQTSKSQGSVDEQLAAQLASKLQIAAVSGEEKGEPVAGPSRRTPRTATTNAQAKPTVRKAMKVIEEAHVTEEPLTEGERVNQITGAYNGASKAVVELHQSGWKASTHKPAAPSKKGSKGDAGVDGAAVVRSWRSATGDVRGVVKKDKVLAVERTVVGLVGKVIEMELVEEALEMLREVKGSLLRLYEHSEDGTLEDGKDEATAGKTKPGGPSTVRGTAKQASVGFVFPEFADVHALPLPLEERPPDRALLDVLAMFQLHAITAMAKVVKSTTQPAFDQVLRRPGNLLDWYPIYSSAEQGIEPQRLRSVLNAAARGVSSVDAPSGSLLHIRLWAMQCLAPSGAITPDKFWEQVVTCAKVFAKSAEPTDSEIEMAKLVCGFFESIVGFAQRVPPVGEEGVTAASVLFASPKFGGVCEYWMRFAKFVGDVEAINRISVLLGGEGGEEGKGGSMGVAGLLVALERATLLLKGSVEGQSVEPDPLIYLPQAVEVLSSCPRYFRSDDVAEDDLATRRKLFVAIDDLGRICERSLRAAMADKTAQDSEVISKVDEVTKGVVKFGAEVLTARKTEDPACAYREAWVDILDGTIDCLCILARYSLHTIVSSSRAVNPTASYDLLKQALALSRVGPPPVKGQPHSLPEQVLALPPKERLHHANVLRRLSAAFHHCAATLLNAGKDVASAPFWKQAAELSVDALAVWDGVSDKTSHMKEGEEESWSGLREKHIWVRWELLGHSLVRNERKVAYEAYVRSLKTRPASFYEELAGKTRTMSIRAVFNAEPRFASIVEKLTSLATFDLFLMKDEKESGTLRQPLEEAGVPLEAVGATLEYQVMVLDPVAHREESGCAIRAVLKELKEVYGGEHPIRRARVLLRMLEFAYSVDDSSLAPSPLVIHGLLGSKNLGTDGHLAMFVSQYSASLEILLSLQAHRHQDAENSTGVVLQHANKAIKIMRGMVDATPEEVIPTKPVRKGVKGRTTKVTRVVGKGKAAAVPKTPKRPVPVDALTEAVASLKITSSPETIVLDDGEQFYRKLESLAHLLGLLGHVFHKVEVLDIVCNLCERTVLSVKADAVVQASFAIAHEYVKLGKHDRAAAVYARCLRFMEKSEDEVTLEVRAVFLLKYAESLATIGKTEKSLATYVRALKCSEKVVQPEKSASTVVRVRARILALERSALACNVYAAIQQSRDDLAAEINGLLQALRLWNHAIDVLARSRQSAQPVQPKDSSPNPFQATVSASSSSKEIGGRQAPSRTWDAQIDGMQWRLADGLTSTLFALGKVHFIRGSVRASEFFIQKANELAASLNAPVLLSRALAREAEKEIAIGRLDSGYGLLVQAGYPWEQAPDVVGPDLVDLHRLQGDHNIRAEQIEEAKRVYGIANELLGQLEEHFTSTESLLTAISKRQSVATGEDVTTLPSTLVPGLLASVLRQHIWLLRTDVDNPLYEDLLNRLLTLPASPETKVEENLLFGKLTLEDVMDSLQADLFLSSLTESAIALPTGMSSGEGVALPTSTREILASLANAEKYFWAGLELSSSRGEVHQVRDAALSLTLIRAFQTSLGKGGKNGAVIAASLLDVSAAVTLRRELLECIDNKFRDANMPDDMAWPMMNANGSPLPPSAPGRKRLLFTEESEDDEPDDEGNLQAYWQSIKRRYRGESMDPAGLASPLVDQLPANWTVVNISVTDDKRTLFVSRQRARTEPLIFCLPLDRQGRREGEDEENHFSYEKALEEFNDIIRLSDESTKSAKDLADKQARVEWWAERTKLDLRLKELLENIEYCWLGAFKTIFSEPTGADPECLSALRSKFDKVFKRNGVVSREKKAQLRVRLDDALVECFSTLSPKCRDEEIEDLVYFFLDLFQLHGAPVALSDIDIDQVALDLQSTLEECNVALRSQQAPRLGDHHLFLVLDKHLQGLPWESIPALRGRSVSRIPSISFLLDRVEMVQHQNKISRSSHVRPPDRTVVDPTRTFYVLNPSGDLKTTQTTFEATFKTFESSGWRGITGRVPSEEEMLQGLQRSDLFLYFGHGGAQNYIRSHKIRNLPRCAATMLWGCSSGALHDMGDFDRIGNPNHYMLAGCPTLVANLWDVTDREIDRIAQSVLGKLGIDKAGLCKQKQGESRGDAGVSVVQALAESREVCKLKYLTGAAPVIYGIPFYL